MKKLITLILVAVLMISFAVVANAAVGTVVKANKVDKAPNLEEIDESWGEPAITVTPDSPNTELFKYWNEFNDTAMYEHEGTGPNGRQTIQPEDHPFDLYLCWDDKYLYLGVLSADYEICGSVEPWRGDGVLMWIQPLEILVANNMTHCGIYNYTDGLTDPTTLEFNKTYADMCEYYWTLEFDDYSVSNAGAAADCEKYILMEDDMMHATIAIPLSNLGLNAKKMDLHGYELGTAILRTSSRSSFDEGYAGWLAWGKYHEYYTVAESFNTIVLVDPAKGDVNPDTNPIATEPVVVEPVVTEPVEEEGPAAQIGDVLYDTFAEAVAAVKDEETIVLLRNTLGEGDIVVDRVVWFLINGEGGNYPNLVPGEGLTKRASGSPMNPYLGMFIFEGNVPETEPVVTDAPETEPVVTDAPETEPVVTDAPETEPVVTDAPETEPVVTGAPETEPVVTDAPETEPVVTDAPETEPVVTDAPETEPVVTDAPETEPVVTDAPETEPVVTDAPKPETTPATEVPKTDDVTEKSNTGLIIGIVAAVVVVGAGLGIVLGKKKK